MQPTQYPNPGVSAYEPPPPTLLGDRGIQVRSEAALSSTAAAPADIEPEPKTVGEAPPKADAAKKIATTGARRKRAPQPTERDASMAYGAQQSFGSYRPWGGYQPWGNQSSGYQSWGYQSWSYQSRGNQSRSNQSWGSYRSSGSYQSQSGAQSRR